MDKRKKFYDPNTNWKYIDNDKINTSEKVKRDINDNNEDTVQKHFEFFNWSLSFTKNVVRACFILFLIVNIFITAMITVVFFTTQEITALETYITEVYNMFVTVIGGYIIKSAAENTVKIVFSVLSEWLEKKYGVKHKSIESEDNFCESGGTIPDPDDP